MLTSCHFPVLKNYLKSHKACILTVEVVEFQEKKESKAKEYTERNLKIKLVCLKL